MDNDQKQVTAEEDDLQEIIEGIEDEEIVDPGQNEGKAKPRKADGPDENHPRFKKVYAQMKQNERDKEELSKKLEAIEAEAKFTKEAFQEHNKKLVEAIEKMGGKDAKVAAKEVDNMEDTIADLEEEMEKAFDEGEFGKGMKLQTKINKIMRLHMKSPAVDTEKIKSDISAEMEAKMLGELTFGNWVKDNQWYNEDKIAKAAADNLAIELAKSGKYSYKDLLGEVGKQITERFGFDKKINRNKLREVPSVDSGNGSKGKLSGVRNLNEDEKRLATMSGMTEQEMLKQVLLAEGRSK